MVYILPELHKKYCGSDIFNIMTKMVKTGKVLLAVLLIVTLLGVVLEKKFAAKEVIFGVTFSPRYVSYLKLDWQKVYIQILDDLKVKDLRIPSYWDMLEPQKGQYDFSQTDFMIKEAGKYGAKVILVLGARQPRWPECQVPTWAKNLSVADRQKRTLEFIKSVVERYKNSGTIWAWQIENEPFVVWFGQNCDLPDKKFLQEEINIVKKLDSKRPIIVTDSGEWSSWITTMKFADILGISLYRKAYNPALSSYITYPFPAWMYPVKSDLVRKLFAPQNSKTIISEFQAEPWVQKSIPDTSLEQQLELFSIEDFQNNIEFGKKTGFEDMYLWGAEWWFYMAQQGYPQYLEYAKTLFR